MARTFRKPLLEQRRLFLFERWRKVEKRCAQIEKPGVLFACSAFPGYSQLSHLCHLLVSYREKRDVDFDTFFEKTHHFLLSIRLRPLTREEKLSQMCQETVGFETIQKNKEVPCPQANCKTKGLETFTRCVTYPNPACRARSMAWARSATCSLL